MSRKIELMEISPEVSNRNNNPEIYQFAGYDCPSCGGKGYSDFSGWTAKYKKNYDDPDEQQCQRCGGSGKLQASVLVKWMAEKKE